jgi:hypothetical protein
LSSGCAQFCLVCVLVGNVLVVLAFRLRLERTSEPNGSRVSLSASKTVRFVSCCMRIVDRAEWCREAVLFGEEIGQKTGCIVSRWCVRLSCVREGTKRKGHGVLG